MTNNELVFEPELIAKIITDPAARIAVARQSHLWFFVLYFPHHIFYELADFQKEIFGLTQDASNLLAIIAAFRGSGKTTVVAQSFPIWAITGMLEKKYVLIISKTAEQAKQIFKNIKTELETNELLKADLGPFYEENEEWKSYSLVLPKFGARITAVSSEQSIRGTKHGANRPDLIILDDVEDLGSVKTKESRNSIYRWFTGDIIPLGDKNTQIFIIGNVLHPDSLIMRLKKNISSGKMNGVYKGYPLLDEDKNIAWTGKYPDMNAVEIEKKKVADESTWQREYLLNPVLEENQIIHPVWIKKYKDLKEYKNYRHTISSVDPAIGTGEQNDFTAIVTAKIYGYDNDLRICILPNPINKKMNFPETVATVKQIHKNYKSRVLVECNAYQKSLAEQLKLEGVPAEEVTNYANDKTARLKMISHLIEQGKVLLPEFGAEELIEQLLNFGFEKHDDLVDAFTMLVTKASQESKKMATPEIYCI